MIKLKQLIFIAVIMIIGVNGLKAQVQNQGAGALTTTEDTGNKVISKKQNADGTILLTYSDGTTYTTAPMLGKAKLVKIKEDVGNNIVAVVKNLDGSLKISYSDGTTYTTPSTKSYFNPYKTNDVGHRVFSSYTKSDGTIKITYADGSTYITPTARVEKIAKAE